MRLKAVRLKAVRLKAASEKGSSEGNESSEVTVRATVAIIILMLIIL